MKERDCANCIHHTEDGCSSWDCEFEAKDLISRADAIEAVLTYFIPRSHTGERGEYEEDFVRTIFKTLPSADAEQGVGRYENAMQKLREMPSYLNGVKAKQIKKISADAVHIETYRELYEKYVELKHASAEAVQGWIPCSERLPEKDELVLVTVWNDVTIAWRNIYGGWESAEDMYEKGDVKAWMPLPKPYKGGDTE